MICPDSGDHIINFKSPHTAKVWQIIQTCPEAIAFINRCNLAEALIRYVTSAKQWPVSHSILTLIIGLIVPVSPRIGPQEEGMFFVHTQDTNGSWRSIYYCIINDVRFSSL